MCVQVLCCCTEAQHNTFFIPTHTSLIPHNSVALQARQRALDFNHTCQQHAIVREQAQQRLLTRRARVREVAQQCVITNNTPPEDTRFVPNDWFVEWATQPTVGPMDTSPLLCVHSKLLHTRAYGAYVG